MICITKDPQCSGLKHMFFIKETHFGSEWKIRSPHKWWRYRPFHKTLPRSSAFCKLDLGNVLWNGLYLTVQPSLKRKKKEKCVVEVWATKNVIKDKMTRRIDLLLRIFYKIAKKFKLKSPKKAQFSNEFRIIHQFYQFFPVLFF